MVPVTGHGNEILKAGEKDSECDGGALFSRNFGKEAAMFWQELAQAERRRGCCDGLRFWSTRRKTLIEMYRICGRAAMK